MYKKNYFYKIAKIVLKGEIVLKAISSFAIMSLKSSAAEASERVCMKERIIIGFNLSVGYNLKIRLYMLCRLLNYKVDTPDILNETSFWGCLIVAIVGLLIYSVKSKHLHY